MNYLNSPKNRIILTLFLLILLAGLCFYYNFNHESNARYPSSQSILTSNYEGKNVLVSGDFVGFYSGGFYIKDDGNGLNIIYKINSTFRPVDGDIVSVLGTLSSPNTVAPNEMVINKRWKENFILLRSAFIGVILILLFWRYWRFDLKNMEFRRK